MNERKKVVKKILDRAKKLGLNMDKVTEGKSIDTLARNSKTIDNLQKRFNRQKQQPKLKKEVEQIDRKIAERAEQRRIEKMRNIRRNLLTDEAKADLKWNHDMDVKNITKKTLKNKTEETVDKFLNTYFKEIKHQYEAQKMMNKIKKRFGVRLDIAYDFIKYATDQAFKYEIPKEIMKTDTPLEYSKMLNERLEYFERVISKEFDL